MQKRPQNCVETPVAERETDERDTGEHEINEYTHIAINNHSSSAEGIWTIDIFISPGTIPLSCGSTWSRERHEANKQGVSRTATIETTAKKREHERQRQRMQHDCMQW